MPKPPLPAAALPSAMPKQALPAAAPPSAMPKQQLPAAALPSAMPKPPLPAAALPSAMPKQPLPAAAPPSAMPKTTASGSSATVRDAETSHSDSSANHLQPISPVLQRQKIIAAKRKGVATAQLDQAERMVKRRSRYYDSWTSRWQCDHTNTSRWSRSMWSSKYHGNYQESWWKWLLCHCRAWRCAQGKVFQEPIRYRKYSRNQFDICKHVLLNETDVKLDVQVSLREGVNFESKCGGQGFLKCSCSGSKRCGTKRCKCFRANVMCNSRCHSSLLCSNKIE